jgi:predicted RNA-binding protein with PIN domain
LIPLFVSGGQDMEHLLIDGITLLGNLGTNDHVKALIRLQKGIDLIIDIMKTYENFSRAVCIFHAELVQISSIHTTLN